MRVIARKTLEEYWRRHADSEVALREWHRIVRHAQWHRPNDVIGQFPTASIIEGDRVVFRIRGNRYRIVVWVTYQKGIAYIKWVGTHAEYNGIDARTVGM